MVRCFSVVACLSLGGGAPASLSAAEDAKPAVSADHATKMAQGLSLFKSDVRELLVKHCLDCHGGKQTKSEFDLSSRESLLKEGTQGENVVPGESSKSRLVKMLTHAEKPGMPYKLKKLPDDAIGKISRWVDLGAPYDKPLVGSVADASAVPPIPQAAREYWAFQPLRRVAPPAAREPAWNRHEIDRFLFAKLEQAGIRPNPPVDRRKLIRRAYFDLLGVPPTPEEITRFLDDPAADAYERLIDRLLLDPRHGERWARHWLDLARFAESHGYEQDYDRKFAYHYRDFVIKALNQDMPYDQFVRWQLAGDEFAPDDPLAMAATGYLGCGTHATQITANQVEKERYDELDDMAGNLGTTMLGLTIGCARCHDHKFDPIPTHDYYRLLSSFTTTVRSEIDLDLDPSKTKRAKAEFDKAHAPFVKALETYDETKLPGRFEAWLASNPKPPRPTWLVLSPDTYKSSGGAKLAKLDDGSVLASGNNPPHETYTFTFKTRLREIRSIRLEALAHPGLVKGGPGRATNGNFALNDFKVGLAPVVGGGSPISVKLRNARATFEQKGLAVSGAIDDKSDTAWAVDPALGKDHAAVFELDTPFGYRGGTLITVSMRFTQNAGHAIARPRISISGELRPVDLKASEASEDLARAIAEAIAAPASKRTENHKAALLAHYREIDPERAALSKALRDHLALEPRPTPTKVQVTSEGFPAIRLHTQGADYFEKTYFLKRGDLSQKVGEADQGFLRVLTSAPEGENAWRVDPPGNWRTSYRRRSLANWITDVDQGAGRLLARVIVNRLWHHHMGRGLVATPSDFGVQGERPSHPELLDHLALELIKNGWKLKPIHRSIMLSAAYRQGVEVDPERLKVDPQNKLLWHRPRRRLEGEAIRDAMLAIGGSLDPTMYGPGSLDESSRRRSVYFTIKRSQLIPMMVLFDAPDSLVGIGARPTTTIAPQALAMLNNPHVRSYAEGFAKRLESRAKESPAEAARYAYESALGRPPATEESAEAVEFLRRQTQARGRSGAADAASQALADFCHSLFCLNEFIYVE